MIAITQFLVHKVLLLSSHLFCQILRLGTIAAWVFFVISLTSPVYAAEVTLTWEDWENNPDEVGLYIVYVWQENWDFPESHPAGLNDTHTLFNLNAGEVYDFAVTVADADGQQESEYSNIVSVSLPASDFDVGATNGPAPLPITFTDLSTGNIASWLWDFGDGYTSTEQAPTHTYTFPGVYTVSLKVSGPEGSDTFTVTDLITVTQGSTATSMHVEDLDGWSISNGRTWTAMVSIAVYDANHGIVAGAEVYGTWRDGYAGTGMCTTDHNGVCSISSGDIRKNESQTTFTIDAVTHDTFTYQPADSHDRDGDSDGVQLTIRKP